MAKARRTFDGRLRVPLDRTGAPRAKALFAGASYAQLPSPTATRAIANGDDRSHLLVAIAAPFSGFEDSLRSFLSSFPAEVPAAFVVARTESPGGPEQAVASRRIGDLPLFEARAGIRIEPGRVFVIPTGHSLKLRAGRFVAEPRSSDSVTGIDALFCSVAAEYGELALGVLLTEVSTNAAIGLQAIRERGGVIVASASHASKEATADASGHGRVDWLLPGAEVGPAIARYASQLRCPVVGANEASERDITQRIDQILTLVRNASGHDFAQYKPNTIVRRIQRRMRVCQTENVGTYVELLKSGAEADLLFRDMLIGVTQFFRDPAAFSALEQHVIPDLLDRKAPGGTVRIWVPGCSTGEEAYSLAILFHEYIERHGLDVGVKVFATDLDEAALKVARQATYPGSIESYVASHRLSRFFRTQDARYRVAQRIRDSLVFSVQNVISDAPLAKIDLISCRNLLIYLRPELQTQLVAAFHFALVRDGFLFLGPSEGLAGVTSLFSIAEKEHRIFRRRDVPMRAAPPRVRVQREPASEKQTVVEHSNLAPSLATLVERVVLQSFAPACVVVNEQHEIIYFLGGTGKYLNPPVGAPALNVLEMARPELRAKLRGCLQEAIAETKTAVRRAGSAQRPVRVTAKPVPGLAPDSGLYLVVFEEEVRNDANADWGEEPGKDSVIQELETELSRTRGELRSIVAEFESGAEELKSSNEELLSINEELQSSNEGLMQAKEELQSVNEELETVNAELKFRLDELSHANSDIRNLFENTRIATLFLDREYRIRNFTPATRDLFNLIDSDRGRPIDHISQRFRYDDLLGDVAEVLRTLVPKEAQVESITAGWYMMRILPYWSIENLIDGAVVTFTDITELKRAELEVQRLSVALQVQLRWLETLVDVVPVGIGFHEKGQKALRINRTAAELLGLTTEPISRPGDPLPYTWWPDHRASPAEVELHKAMTGGDRVRDLEIELLRRSQLKRHVLVHAAPIVDDSGAAHAQVSAWLDVTEIKHAREQAIAREQQQAIIAELGLRALEQSDFAAFLHQELALVASGVRAELCEIVQVAGDGTRLNLLSAWGFAGRRDFAVEEEIRPASSASVALGQREPVMLYPGDLPSEEWPDYLSKEGVTSGARIAIWATTGEPFGLLGVYSRTPRLFSKQDLVFLRAIANVFTSAIQRKVIEEAHRRESETAALRRSEEQLRRAERLASLGTFATGIAHELNNPLSNIALSAEYAEKTEDPQRQTKLLANIRANAQRCGRIVESVLRFAKNEATQKWPTDIGSVIRRSVDLVRSYVGSERIAVTLALCEPMPKIVCNPTEMEQVFVNLLRNAVEAHPGKCQVVVRCERAGAGLHIWVSDDGPGIAAKDRERIFDPFFSTHRSSGGTGLGLSITHRILTGHGGALRVAGEQGKGATFEIELPGEERSDTEEADAHGKNPASR